MPLNIIRDDITLLSCDAIVNAANNTLLGGGGVDGAIHAAAGRGLYDECKTLGGCETGQAKITGGYNLPCKYVIHTVGPVFRDGAHGEETLLRSCYRNSLILAVKNGCESVAFPLISAGVYGYPRQEAFITAVDEISLFLRAYDGDLSVTLVVFDKSSYLVSKELVKDIDEFLGKNYVEEFIGDAYAADSLNKQSLMPSQSLPAGIPSDDRRKILNNRKMRAAYYDREENAAVYSDADIALDFECDLCEPAKAKHSSVLDEALKNLDESFSQMLLRKIDESGMTDSQCYKKANIDRKLFSKIRSDCYYKPSKSTALAFAIALELPLDEAKSLLMKAGYALSHSNKADVIIEYFISHGNYNIFEINEVLFEYDQLLLGA